jgi:hypothetical protein
MQVRIYAIGMGGIGSFLMAPLSKMVQHGSLNKWRLESLVLVDGDSYTDSNLSRQFFPRACSGMNKAMAQQVVLNALAGPEQGARVVAVPSFVLRKNIHTILPMPSYFPVIISMVDNHECRKILSEHCAWWASRRVPHVLITGGNRTDDGNVTVQGFLEGEKMGVDLLERHPEIAISTEGTREGLSCLEIAAMPGGEQTMAANMMVAMSIYSVLYSLSTEDPQRMDWVRGLQDIYFELSPLRVQPVMAESGASGKETDNAMSLD